MVVCLEAGVYLPAQLYRRWEMRSGLQGQASSHSMLLRLRGVAMEKRGGETPSGEC